MAISPSATGMSQSHISLCAPISFLPKTFSCFCASLRSFLSAFVITVSIITVILSDLDGADNIKNKLRKRWIALLRTVACGG